MEKPTGAIKIIGGKWRGRLLPVFDYEGLRPTPNRVRETLFNWLQPTVVDAKCLDLFAGTGALGFEALSRGAKEVTYVEYNLTVMKQLQNTAKKFDASANCIFKHQDAMQYLRSFDKKITIEPFDIIFLDPPFGSALLDNSLIMLGQSVLVGNNTLLYVEASIALPEAALPPHWQLLRQKKAGAVFYHLIQGGTFEAV